MRRTVAENVNLREPTPFTCRRWGETDGCRECESARTDPIHRPHSRPHAKNNEILSVPNFAWEEAPSRARRILTPGDTIFGTVRPGNRSFALVPPSDQVLTGSTGFAVLTPKSELHREFLYLSVIAESNLDRLTTVASGAAYPAVNPEVVTEQLLALPPHDTIEAFHQALASSFDLIERHRAQNQELTTLRDWLLPMLMNGQVRVG